MGSGPFGWSRVLRVACPLVAVLCGSSLANARPETIRWLNGDPDPGFVDAFLLYTGQASGSYGAPIDIGLPTPDDLSLSTITCFLSLIPCSSHSSRAPLTRFAPS